MYRTYMTLGFVLLSFFLKTMAFALKDQPMIAVASVGWHRLGSVGWVN